MKKLIISTIILLSFTITSCSSKTNANDMSNKSEVNREDKFIKEKVTIEYNAGETFGSGESNIKEDEKPLAEVLENTPLTEQQPVFSTNNIWDCSKFKDIQLDDFNSTELVDITNNNLLKLLNEELSEEADLFIYAINKICIEYDIELTEIRLLKDTVLYSEDYSYAGISIQSDNKYINIAFSFDNNRLCYDIEDKT